MNQTAIAAGTHDRLVDRRSVVRILQRRLVPFLSADFVEKRLGEIESAGILARSDSGKVTTYELIRTLTTCFSNHPTFFEAREWRTLRDEREFFLDPATQRFRGRVARYRIEQRITVVDQGLSDNAILYLWLPAPRQIRGVQHVQLLSAEPCGLAEHYLPIAGQIYGAPLLIEPGRTLPQLELVFEVEQAQSSVTPFRECDIVADVLEKGEAISAANWARTSGLDRSRTETTQELVALLVDRIEGDFEFMWATMTTTPVATLLASRKGDTLMRTHLLAAALSGLGISTRVGAGQQLMLGDGNSRLFYPGSHGYEHSFLQWSDPDRKESGCVDLSYLERWCFAATEANTINDSLRAQLDEVGVHGRQYLRHNPYPIDLIVAGRVPNSLMRCYYANESYMLSAPVDVQFDTRRLE